MFEYFCPASKIRIEVIKGKDQKWLPCLTWSTHNENFYKIFKTFDEVSRSWKVNPKEAERINLTSPIGFSKNVSSGERMKPCFLLSFNKIMSHIFPEIFIKIPLVVQKIWRFSASILSISVTFSYFLTFPCYNELNDVSI